MGNREAVVVLVAVMVAGALPLVLCGSDISNQAITNVLYNTNPSRYDRYDGRQQPRRHTRTKIGPLNDPLKRAGGDDGLDGDSLGSDDPITTGTGLDSGSENELAPDRPVDASKMEDKLADDPNGSAPESGVDSGKGVPAEEGDLGVRDLSMGPTEEGDLGVRDPSMAGSTKRAGRKTLKEWTHELKQGPHHRRSTPDFDRGAGLSTADEGDRGVIDTTLSGRSRDDARVRQMATDPLPPGYRPPTTKEREFPPGYRPPTTKEREFPPGYKPPTTKEREFPPGNRPPTTKEREFPPGYRPSKRDTLPEPDERDTLPEPDDKTLPKTPTGWWDEVPRVTRDTGSAVVSKALKDGGILKMPSSMVRVVAWADTHGDWDAFRAILTMAGVNDISSDEARKHSDTLFVTTGDFMDRGDSDMKILRDLALMIEAGFHLYVVAGNHEVLVATGDWRYRDLSAYNGPGMEAALKEDIHQVFDCDGKYASFIRERTTPILYLSKPSVHSEKILFMHGGLSEAFATRFSKKFRTFEEAVIAVNRIFRGGLQSLCEGMGALPEDEWDQFQPWVNSRDMVERLQYVVHGCGSGSESLSRMWEIPMDKFRSEYTEKVCHGEAKDNCDPTWDRTFLDAAQHNVPKAQRVLNRFADVPMSKTRVVVGHSIQDKPQILAGQRIFGLDTAASAMFSGGLRTVMTIHNFGSADYQTNPYITIKYQTTKSYHVRLRPQPKSSGGMFGVLGQLVQAPQSKYQALQTPESSKYNCVQIAEGLTSEPYRCSVDSVANADDAGRIQRGTRAGPYAAE